MKKQIKKIGNSVGIIFNREDCAIYDIEVNDVVDISDIAVTKKKHIKKRSGK